MAEVLDSGIWPGLNRTKLITGYADADEWEMMGAGHPFPDIGSTPPPTVPVLAKLMWPDTDLESWQ